jgi:hypothetical protein
MLLSYYSPALVTCVYGSPTFFAVCDCPNLLFLFRERFDWSVSESKKCLCICITAIVGVHDRSDFMLLGWRGPQDELEWLSKVCYFLATVELDQWTCN